MSPRNPRFLLKLYNQTLKKFFYLIGKTTFKKILVPGYKLFLFIKKHTNRYLVNNPYLPSYHFKKEFKQNSLVHIIIIIITTLVVANNIITRDIYAEEFKRNSIMAKILTDELDTVIIEKAIPVTNHQKTPPTETVMDQLAALEPKNNIGKEKPNTKNNQIALSQGDAIIQPGLNTSSEENNTSTTSFSSGSSKKIATYIVQQGDTLSGIAKKFNLSINTILWENNLSLNSYIRPGDKITILPIDGITYTIRSGDTLGAIANRYGSTVDKILAANNLESASVIRASQKLVIPDGKLGGTTPTKSKSIYSSRATSGTGQYIWPSTSKRITQYYHWQHLAIDIGAPLGTPIYAIDSGKVIYAGWSTGYGYNIMVDHGGGVVSRYGHASKLYVKTGDYVERGEQMGEVGSTGWSTGPHIHLEIKINGQKVNPLSYL